MKGCDELLGLQDTLKALADPIRREILNLLKGGRLSAGEICEHFSVTGASISRHLAILKDADLIHKRSTAKEICQAVDSISISLNMPDAASYNEVVRPAYGEKSFDAMLKFARDCNQYLDDVRFTVVDVIGEEKVEQSKILAAQNGIPLRVRKYSP